jgi:general secretion pathway protein B
MSYILEALKKSQQERELGQVPTLDALAPAPQRRSPHVSPWGLATLIMAGLALALALYAALFRGEPQPANQGVDTLAGAPSMPPVPDVQSTALPLPAVSNPAPSPAPSLADTQPRVPAPALASSDTEPDVMDIPASDDWMEMDQEIGPAQPSDAEVEPVPEPRPRRSKPARTTLPEPEVAPIPPDLRRDVAAFREQLERERGGAPRSKAAKDTPLDPTKLKLPLDVQARLPAFIMTAHIYDAVADKRFIVINSLKYREGDTTREGLKVDTILQNGVVLDFEHNRFYRER